MRPVSRLFLPPPNLSGCLFAAIYRDTRGAGLSEPDRLNHFPASPLVTLTLVRCGELRLLPAGSDWPAAKNIPPLPPVVVTGPQDAPISSWAPGECVAITIGFYPDAWFQLGGDKEFSRPPTSIEAALDPLNSTQDPGTGWEGFCQVLGTSWAGVRPTPGHGISGIADWVRAVVTRSALSGSGRSLRSLERRVKRISGQTRRTLKFYSAFENLHSVSRQNPETSLAEIAVEAGYSDQSHMGRAVRRATGLSPARLNRAIQTEEAFWCYRLLGERF